MTESEIQCLKDNVDKTVEIETRSGEFPIAKILFVTHCEEYDEHDLLNQVVPSSRSQFYSRFENSGGFVLDFDEIVSVKPHH
jgi:hypothetical protein